MEACWSRRDLVRARGLVVGPWMGCIDLLNGKSSLELINSFAYLLTIAPEPLTPRPSPVPSALRCYDLMTSSRRFNRACGVRDRLNVTGSSINHHGDRRVVSIFNLL